jgi:hypothetical protein
MRRASSGFASSLFRQRTQEFVLGLTRGKLHLLQMALATALACGSSFARSIPKTTLDIQSSRRGRRKDKKNGKIKVARAPDVLEKRRAYFSVLASSRTAGIADKFACCSFNP